ncbi:[protein-PII] uridylyltransferase [Donghicola sp. C2-DW-16]|uniref:Bifunctional uridylyltransferase/uridylyl-removing enzyme n=1 Tax=Donghicola mangrovi TaxID=2729614 RepID=A0ABX2PAY1_9RHOB|nr:[protein-PII] uridylyltransferase [Donghicola mangrovi]NVO26621.1 [protein-PII] uridylyltransferase [Donghicola mangrovi]
MTNDLICPAEEIFDRAAIDTAIASAFAEAAGNTSDFRKNALKILQDAQKLGRTRIEEALAKSPFAARETTHAYTYLTDGLVIAVLKIASTYIHPLATPTEGEKLSVLAVGGYGRGDMAPFSDVDLLFLTPYKITPWAESVIETMLYLLWDLRMKVGHASRTIPDCIRLAKEDFTIRTALLEQRYLAGDEALANKLHTRLRDDLFKSTGREFIAAKLEERDTRHEKQGGQRYVVEPNVKEGKGGLRDLQSMFWIAKYVHGVDDAADLVPLGVFTKDEYRLLVRAEDFLWATRCHLHLVTNRPTEQLTFDLQVEIASRMGYVDTGGRRAVEHFMQDYFRHATSVGDLTRIFLTSLEASHNKPGPSLATLFRRRKKLRDGYKEINNRLAIVNDKEFLSDPLNFLQLFDEALRTGLLIHPDAMRLVVANLKLINDEMRNDPAANKIFLDLLLKRGNPERALRRMNELGVLAAFMPEFAPIVAMMQFNMYHSYTVDEHTIQCISQMAQIERQELTEPLPLASSIFDEGLNRKVLYVAMLLHDIGKGRKEDHSILGAQIARRVTPRLGLKKEECETVEWLVRYHLLMSDVAQKRDISDPRTVRDFAKVVKNRKRLDLLTVLTVCDIRGVGPDTWNNWKAMLLRQLHAETAKALEHGLEEINRETRGNEARKALRDALPKWSEADLKHETKRHYPPYWTGLPPQTHVIFAELLKDIPDDEIRIDLKPDTDRDATRACFAMADHPGIFARLAGALALVGANVVDARTYTSKDGYATAVFWVQDADGHPYEESRLPRLRDMIGKTLKGEVLAGKALKDKDKFKKREKAFRVPTHITFDNEGSEIYTIIEVDTRDRPGLLYDLARTLSGANVYISSAVIATYGEQVVDTFYVKDMFGLKFHSASRRESLEKKLREAIDKGVERAIA